MEERLKAIVDGLRAGRFVNERSVSQGVVLAILDALGWTVFDPSVVAPEYGLGTRRVDFALLDATGKPKVFIEVKRPGRTQGSDVQLFEYAFHEGVPMAILTDGQEWSIYLPAEQGSYEERRVYKLDLLERDLPESSLRLRRYLGVERVLSGAALTDARADYTDAAKGRQILRILPLAWTRILTERDEVLLDLLADKVEDLCGFRPSSEDCTAFLSQVAAAPTRRAAEPATPLPSPPPRVERAQSVAHGTPPPDAANAPDWFQLRGQRVHTKSARQVLEGLLTALAQDDSTFLERFTARRHGRRRRYVSRDRQELYPERPDLAAAHAVEFLPGWWLGTNYSREEIEKILNLACEVSELGPSDVAFAVG